VKIQSCPRNGNATESIALALIKPLSLDGKGLKSLTFLVLEAAALLTACKPNDFGYVLPVVSPETGLKSSFTIQDAVGVFGRHHV
jgi:hypothetical protein